jgi:aldose 1-epimerase
MKNQSNIHRILITLIGVGLLAGCAANKNCCDASTSCCAEEVTNSDFGTFEGQPVYLYTLQNKHGALAKISTFGGMLTQLKVPDKNGQLVDVVLGCDKLDAYVANRVYLGSIVGRFGNRIGKGKFTLNGTEYTLATNNGPNHLHGGVKGFDRCLWTGKPVDSDNGATLELTYRSVDGEEGYPGNLDVTARFTLTDANELKVEFTAQTDKDTVCNLTYHPYFNLAGGGTILDHQLVINADNTTPTDAGQIPTGETRPVAGTPFDFRQPMAVGARINADDEQLKYGVGYDHNWVVNQTKPGDMTLHARVSSPVTGISLEVHSTEPCVQFYSGNFLDGSMTGWGGRVYTRRTGLCLEPQHAPDSPNKPSWPTVVLKPGQTYSNTIIYRFTAK